MPKAIKIICVADYFLPGYKGGGPTRTLANMQKALKGHVEINIFTRDRDLGTNAPYDGVPSDRWLPTDMGPVYYATPEMFGISGLKRAFEGRAFDLLYLNSFFGLNSSILVYLWARRAFPSLPMLVAPRGEFSLGALELKSIRKRVYIKLARTLGLYSDIEWHASTEEEKSDILRQFPQAKVHLAEDPVCLEVCTVGEPAAHDDPGEALRIVFISRISPMKNLDGLLRILIGVSCPLLLDIYGPIEDRAYWTSCESLIETMPPNIRVDWRGELEPSAVSSVFASYDLFVFPTFGENFGHVIFESLRAGTPAVISDRTPWKTVDSGAITALALDDIESWRAQLHKAASYSEDEKLRLREAARSYAEEYARDCGSFARNLAMFTAAARPGTSAQPPHSYK